MNATASKPSPSIIMTLIATASVLAALVIILSIAYVLGRPLLVEKIGNDGPHQLSYVMWLAQYFPEIPDWFPVAGGGYSVARAYPILPFYLMAGASILTGLSSLEIFHLAAFLSVAATAVGIFMLCWIVLGNKVVGLVSSAFYLLSPISWFYVYEHGLVSTVIATAVIPFAIISLDQYLDSRDEEGVAKSRVWFALFVILSAFAILTHLAIGTAIALIAVIYSLVRVAFSTQDLKVKVLGRTVQSGLILALALLLLIAFWMIPVITYASATGDSLSLSPEMIREHKQYLEELVSITGPDTNLWAANASFPTFIVAFAALGLIFAWIRNWKAGALSLIALFALISAGSTGIKVGAARIGSFAPYFMGERTLLVTATLLIPIAGALGIWAIAKVLSFPVAKAREIVSVRMPFTNAFLFPISIVLAPLLLVFIAAAAIFGFRNVSSGGGQYLNYGVSRLNGVDVNDIWRTGQKHEDFWRQLSPENWPAFQVATSDQALEEAIKTLALLPEGGADRIGISPYIGRLAQNMVLLSDTSQSAIYTATADLIKPFQGYKGNILYSREPTEVEFASPQALNQIAAWFGLQYVFTQPDMDPVGHYVDAGWNRIGEFRYGGLPIELWEFPGHNQLASLTSKPLVLVIGQNDVNSYESIFKLSTRGAMPYEEFMLVDGERPLDEYELNELSRFDALVLHGYDYQDSEKAWQIIDQYVRGGGALYVDTGWQWTIPEWEFEQAPAVLPVSRLSWTNYALSDEYSIEAPEIAGDSDPSMFAPLAWEGQPWGVSGASREGVRDWGRVVLSVAGNPLIVAGEYGRGRVVWSGMNLVAHAMDKNNDQEVDLLHSMVAWLLEDVSSNEYRVVVERDHPDRVRVQGEVPAGQRVALYWREAYYPAWHAYLKDNEGDRQELPIYRGGPGFMLIPLESNSSAFEVELIWETPIAERIAALASLLAAGALLAYVIDGVFFEGRAFKNLGGRLQLRRRRNRSQPQGYVEWLEDTSWDDLESGLINQSEPNIHARPNASEIVSETPVTEDGGSRRERSPETKETT